MKLYILFGQRKESYPEEHAPEALEVMDEFAYDENSEWLQQKLSEHEANGEFVALRVVEVDLGSGSQEAIRALLVGTPRITGTVGGEA